MPRPTGWKPLSYTTIAQICGRLILGHDRRAIERECGATGATVGHLADVLLALGALTPTRRVQLTADQDETIWRLIKTTRMTNHQIRKVVGLTSSTAVRKRRVAHHSELRAKGLPVPLCECGDEFQHSHKCRVMSLCPKPILETDRADVLADLIAGANASDIAKRYDVGRKWVERLQRQLSKSQRAKRVRAISMRRRATGLRAVASKRSADLYARLEAVVPRGLPAEVRSETIQEMALEILDGQVTESEAVQRLKAFTSGAYRQLGDPWQNISLDADRDGLTLGECLEDETALLAFDEFDDLPLA